MASWLTGLFLVAQGMVEIHQWRPDQSDPSYPDGIPIHGAVSKKWPKESVPAISCDV